MQSGSQPSSGNLPEDDSLTGSGIFVPHHHDPSEQLKRDIEMISGAINAPGEKPFSASILKKLYTLLLLGEFQKYDKEWQPWSGPIVPALCHGSRVVIQVSPELDQELKAWLFEDEKPENYMRVAATHGLSPRIDDAEKLGETKVPVWWAGTHAAKVYMAWLASFLPVIGDSLAGVVKPQGSHYGVNLALGGVGQRHPHSQTIVANDGQNGHLYLFHSPTQENVPGGWLIGIEQSAPGHANQFGGSHGIWATHHAVTATGGTDFAKTSAFETIGPARYYDGLYLNVTREIFDLAKEDVAEFSVDWLWMQFKSRRQKSEIQLSSDVPKEVKHETPSDVESEAQAKRLSSLEKENEALRQQLLKLTDESNQLIEQLATPSTTVSVAIQTEESELTEQAQSFSWEEKSLMKDNENLNRQVRQLQTEVHASEQKFKKAFLAKVPTWKVLIAATLLVTGFVALVSGIGALAGIPLIVGAGVALSASLTGGGGLLTLMGGLFLNRIQQQEAEQKLLIQNPPQKEPHPSLSSDFGKHPVSSSFFTKPAAQNSQATPSQSPIPTLSRR